MTPAMYSLLINLKIPTTCLLAYVILHYNITKKLIISFIILFLSAVFGTLKLSSIPPYLSLDMSLIGLGLMLIYTTFSSAGSIAIEYVYLLREAKINFFSKKIAKTYIFRLRNQCIQMKIFIFKILNFLRVV